MISLDASSTQNNGTATTTICAWDHTIGSDNSRILLVFAPISQATDVSSVYFGETELTLIGTISNSNSKAKVYYLIAPPIGKNTIKVTYDASLQYLIAGALSFFGVDQVTPYKNVTTATGTATNKTFTQVCQNSDSYIIECYGSDNETETPQSGQTMFFTANRFFSYDTGIAAGNNSQTWNCAGSNVYAWLGFELMSTEINYLKRYRRSRILGSVSGT